MFRIIVPEHLYQQIQRTLLPPGERNECFGVAMAGVCRCNHRFHLLVRTFTPAAPSCLLRQSPVSVRPDPRFMRFFWTVAKDSHASLLTIHTHPFAGTRVSFSGIDDRSEAESFPKLVAAVGPGPHASMVLGRDSLQAHWFNAQTGRVEPVDQVIIIGRTLRKLSLNREPQTT